MTPQEKVRNAIAEQMGQMMLGLIEGRVEREALMQQLEEKEDVNRTTEGQN